jgi:hypothetical protein
MERPDLLDSLRESFRMLRARPVAIPLTGAAVILSIGAVCCLFGFVAGPWFACELTAMQLALATGRPVARTRSWLWAGVVLLGSVSLSAAVLWLTLVGLGVDLSVEIDEAAESAGVGWPSAVFGAGSAILVQAFLLPFVYAPFILIDRGGTIASAAAESARLVMRGGVLRHFLLLSTATSIQAAPFLAVTVIVLALEDPTVVPMVVLGALPAAAVAIPLGHGLMVASYVRVTRSELAGGVEAVPPVREAPRALQAVWTLLVIAPIVAGALAGASLVQPSRLRPGPAPPGEVVADLAVDERERTAWIPSTAVQVRARRGRVDVEASDGGGVGRLILPEGASVERVRVVRVSDSWAVEVDTTRGVHRTFVDGSGVRLDDDLHARFADRLSGWALLALVLAMIASSLLMGPSIAALAELTRTADGAQHHRRTRRAWVGAVILVPFAAAALAAGVAAMRG